MTRAHVTLLLFCLAVHNACFVLSTKATLTNRPVVAAQPAQKTFHLRFDEQLLPAQAARPVAIGYDHFFRMAKQYRGFSFQELLWQQIQQHGVDTSGAVVIFECVDGYRPTMDLCKILGHKKAWIACRDESAPAGKPWADSIAHKFTPYYLVWEDVPASDHSYMWPYGLQSLTIQSAATEFKGIMPLDNPAMMPGFELFRENCMKCHSVNRIGGTMGPEFNHPKNITQYWNTADIIAFAKQPASFRDNSRMPPMEHLSDDQLRSIVQYLAYLAEKH